MMRKYDFALTLFRMKCSKDYVAIVISKSRSDNIKGDMPTFLYEHNGWVIIEKEKDMFELNKTYEN